ncbi:hypothetical protein X727_32070 [Mesorhizobium sp. L103C119B0]|uniref:TadE/TadG family type IV pilus assembly protein n=1 Tax=Mesorhizobium sp. L103C119B0 TaxID=1287085 RepID=UPI0003CFC7D0|nr:hypothetical protein X727_32070 [Mesorhizobium sp. L103C119B0]
MSAERIGSRWRRDCSGAAGLEFALIAPFLVMLLFGIFAFGWAMNAVSTVRYTLARELLKRLGQRRRDVALGWEDADPSTVAVSAFQADVLRSAFRRLLRETGAPECQWRDLAKAPWCAI